MRTKALILALAIVVGPLAGAAPADLIVVLPWQPVAFYDFKMKDIAARKVGSNIRIKAKFNQLGPLDAAGVYVKTTVVIPGPGAPVHTRWAYIPGPLVAHQYQQHIVAIVPFHQNITRGAEIRVTVELDCFDFYFEQTEVNNTRTEYLRYTGEPKFD